MFLRSTIPILRMNISFFGHMRVIQVIAALEQPLKAFLLSLAHQMFVDCFNQNWSVGIIMNQIGTTNLQSIN